jgi:putative acetyltransferase
VETLLYVQGEQVDLRSENERDQSAVRAVNTSAFETHAEADLVDKLRKQGKPVVSIVAEQDDSVVGHIMFTPVSITGHPDLKVMGLAPMAVTPEYQRTGIGSALVRAGIEQCQQLGCGAVVVLGHPEYYPRFGFEPAVGFGIGCEYEVPEEAFMAVELEPGYLQGISGVAKYHEAFGDV